MTPIDTVTPAEALPWLASLETACPGCESCPDFVGYAGQLAAEVRQATPKNLCGGTGKVSVLPDLREPCPYVGHRNPRWEGVPGSPTSICPVSYTHLTLPTTPYV